MHHLDRLVLSQYNNNVSKNEQCYYIRIDVLEWNIREEEMDEREEVNERQSLKNQRVRSYFVQAAKKIVLDEGVENISVRKVADDLFIPGPDQKIEIFRTLNSFHQFHHLIRY